MKYKKDLNNFFSTIKKTNKELSDYVDFEKVNNNVEKNIMYLNFLNTLITQDENKFKEKIKMLFEENKKCFSILNLLIAERKSNDSFFIYENKIYSIEEFINNVENIFIFFKETGLLNLIINGKIKNFVDYVYGIEVGMDTNSRKNRYGKKSEEWLYKNIMNVFGSYNYLEIEEQVKIDGKVFDVVITNKKNNKQILMENSFYNSGGSKLSETARAYQKVYSKFSNENRKFYWIVDGSGVFTIKKLLESINENEFIVNSSEIIEKIKKEIK